MRVLGYARVSSREQALGTSLQDQQNALTAHAQSRGLTVHKFYVEAESAVYEKQERREQIRALLQDLRAGDLVLCDKLDRWSRDPEFTYRSMREIRESGARVYFVGEQIDPSTPEGDSMLNMRVLMAREEHKRIRLRTVGTKKLLQNQGYYVEGTLPLGYRRPASKDRTERLSLLIDDDAAQIVRRLFELASGGASLSDLQFHGRGLSDEKKWDRRTIHNMLRNRVYLGEVKNGAGQWIKGKHQAIVSPSLFARVQAGLQERRRGGPRVQSESLTKDWLLRGFAWCDRCRGRMLSAYSGERRGREYAHYYYKCKCWSVVAPEADRLVAALLLARLEELREELGKPATPHAPPTDLDKRRHKLELRRSRLLDQHLDGHISRELLASKLAELDQERTRIDALEAPPVDNTAFLATIEGIRQAWSKMTVGERRDALMALAERVYLARDCPPSVVWRFELAVG